MKKSNFYLLYSDDVSLLNNEVLKLKNSLNINDETIYYDIDNISDIVVEASTVGMFNPYKFIVIDCSSYKDIDISLLEDYFKSYNVNSYLKNFDITKDDFNSLFINNKDELKNNLTIEQVSDFVAELGGEPQMVNDNILIAQTICHNKPGNGSHKLYYYDNTKLFKCYTDCGCTFDIFGLVQRSKNEELPQAVFEVASFFNFS